MNVKRITAIAVIILFIGIVAVLTIFHGASKTMKFDTVAVNDITQSLAEQWELLQGQDLAELPCRQYGLDYVVINNDGEMIKATRRGLNENIQSAVANRDTIVDIRRDGLILGKCILYNNTNELWIAYSRNLLLISVAAMIFTSLFCILYAVFIDRTIFRPFRKLQAFARHVAAGQLELPLEMDRGNLFGAFTESFDLMREELSKARENERLANQSKKELVASLSHDIKTPVASIKAVSEILIVKSTDESEKKQLDIINSKADQINTLITNMFNATLEELQELKVDIEEHPSLILRKLIQNADYNHRAILSPIPECMILADALRLSQVIDNIVSNSYKYADTSINVTAAVNGQFLELAFRDYGTGVSPEEIPLLFHKFYRAENAKGKSGAGLGLYISQYLIEKMSGEIDCQNTEDGFAVILKLKLA